MTQKTFHLAIILDGNRRWARKRALPAAIGHRKGAENLKKLLPAFIARGITHLTV
ncbi:undecaprenyl diphosphate synthase family protein, partial [Patescibacteria group bacterium]|nr:undecaprenyl diphosphate synthase family protein [Patescibacteria group bacterium]